MSAATSNLPAILRLAEEGASKPQDHFPTEKRIAFLEALALKGSARDAARDVGISHMTAYRARRACASFARLWDAAVVLSIPQAEEELTVRAIDGVEEDVLYHGEVVATRRRKDPRLLLAHLGRLDRLAARAEVAALSGCFDDALEALARGEALPEVRVPVETGTSGGHAQRAEAPASAGERGAGKSSPEPCNRCNTSAAGPRGAGGASSVDREPCVPWCAACAGRPGAEHEPMLHVIEEDGREYWCENEDIADVICLDGSFARKVPPPGYADWTEDMDDPDHWENGAYIPELGRRLRAMEAARPRRALPPSRYPNPAEVEELQFEAFEAGVEEWWLIADVDALEAALDALEG